MTRNPKGNIIPQLIRRVTPRSDGIPYHTPLESMDPLIEPFRLTYTTITRPDNVHDEINMK